ncbi:MAG: hypothetical protein ACR2IA_01640 [Pyrinomonadaceae bacterium]
MFCPNCGQEQISRETKFCSRCGFLMIGVTDLIANGGNLPAVIADAQAMSPRKRGIKKGLFIFMLSFLIVPLVTIFSIMIHVEKPFAVIITALLLTVGGLLRMAYAIMFEANAPDANTLEASALQTARNFLGRRKQSDELPPQQSIPVNNYMPPMQRNWRDTNDLSPTSVTDNTTKLLQKED